MTGLIAQYPLGGVTWDYLQYVLGLAQLGHDVYYVEDTGQCPYDPVARTVTTDCDHSVRYLADAMSRFGLDGRWAYHFEDRSRDRSEWFGLGEVDRRAVLASADLLVDVSCTLQSLEDYRRVRRLVYVDTDPVFTQVKLARGQPDFRRRVDAYDVHFSFGEVLAEGVPSTGHRWHPTRQPIVLAEWPTAASRRDVFTTVMNWTSYNPVRYGRRTYGQKDEEFLRFLDLPGMVAPTVLEIAVGPGKTRPTPRALLARKGWRLVDPIEVCLDLDGYRSYIGSSMAEWTVAKNGYVLGQPGWFSCRSACYLAAGRPVVVQDTGFAPVLPVGEGILPFTTIDEAAAGIREVEARYAKHAEAARAIAEEYFDSSRVLSRLVGTALAGGE